ncbi:MAG: TonB-dependent receptor [Gemmatimonas sp.]
MTVPRFVPLLLWLVLSLLAAPRALHAQQVDVIRGRITGPDNAALENVTVVVTSISGNVNRTARSDKQGRFTVTFPGGDGDYLVTLTALGYAVKRFEVKRAADEDILIADAKLVRVGTVLDAMKVTAARDKVSRNDLTLPDLSGTELRIDNNLALPPDQLGDLAAMAATLPGVQLVPGQDGGANGFSVLGLGADQNNTTLNGMQFGGAGLPRDASVLSSLVTSPYDVSRGGFSGGQFSLRTRPGSNFIGRGLSSTFDTPQMQWADRTARSLGQEYANLSLGGSLSGPVVFDKAFYNVAYQLGRRSNDLQTLLNTDATGLQASGIAADSVSRLVSLLQSANVPTAYAGLPSSRIGDQGSIFGAIDATPPSSASGQAFNITFNGSWTRANPATGLNTSLPTTSGERSGWNGGVQGRHSAYLTLRGVGILTETSVGVNASHNDGTPYVLLPAGRVRVNSSFADGTTGVQTLAFGGNQFLGTLQSANGVSAMNQLSWFSANNKHRLKLTSELRRDGNTQDQTINRLGTFSYNSLADLQAGLPLSYTRSLVPRRRDAGIVIGALSLGDSYRRTSALQFQYGVRLDANQFTDSPARNIDVERLLGVRNDLVPNRVFVSPRLGFSWTYGTAAQIGAFAGAFRGPRAVVRGGIGIFQSTPQATLIGSAIDNTGLAGAVQQLVCAGPATPVPDWAAYAQPSTIPERCADGSTGTVFANASPNVSLFAANYRAPRSIRSNLQWGGAVLGNRFFATVDATYSYNTNQNSIVDRNFAGVERFSLVDEANRPVYVLSSSIFPLTGGIASGDSRLVPQFARVTEQRADLNSVSRQVSLRVAPLSFSSGLSWSGSYTYANVREQFRGFSSTAGNPATIDQSRSSFDSRHQLTYNLGYNAFDLIRINWFGTIRSGTPYTPMVGGDINGDGFSNDRAFVFNPTSSTDASVADGMRALLANGSRGARECLESQLGRLAGRNSCQGPWTTTANLSLSLNPLKVRMPQRATLSFNISNPLGAADLMLHGENKLKGWGQNVFADPALLYVRGFNPVSGRYTYEVNQRFGNTNPAFNTFRTPVTLTMMLRYDIAPTRERQVLTQALDRGRRTKGTKAAESMVKAQFSSAGIPNPLATILRDQDTLKLSAAQADSLASLNRRFVVRIDSIWAPVATRLAALPDDYRHDEAYLLYRQAREASIDLLITVAPTVKALLTKVQRRKLPGFVASALDTRYLSNIRSGTAGIGGAAIPGGMGTGMIFTGGVSR